MYKVTEEQAQKDFCKLFRLIETRKEKEIIITRDGIPFLKMIHVEDDNSGSK